MNSTNPHSINCTVEKNKLRISIPSTEIDKLKDDNYSLYENNRILVTSNKLFQFINLFSSEFFIALSIIFKSFVFHFETM